MKRRIMQALAVSLIALVLLTNNATPTLAGTEEKPQPTPYSQKPVTKNTPGAPDYALAVPVAQTGPGFTYQGSLNDEGDPANGQYDLQFTLYDALTDGNQVGSPVTTSNQAVTDGLFSVQLDFGAASFQGSSRWLEIAIKPAGGESFTTLSPRQALTATPYAISLVPGAVITGSLGGPLLTVSNTNTTNSGIMGMTAAGAGRIAGVVGVSTGPNGNGVIGIAHNGTDAWGVFGESANGVGVAGGSTSGEGVYGYSNSGVAGYFLSTSGNGVYGYSASANGIVGRSTYTNTTGVNGQNPLGYGVAGEGITGVIGTGTTGYGVSGRSTNGVGGYFTSTNNKAVEGQVNNSMASISGKNTGSGIGVKGEATTGDGLQGYSSTGTGVAGISGGASAGVYGQSVDGRGLYGTSTSSEAVYGYTGGNNSAVFGQNGTTGTGVRGESQSGYGVSGTSTTGNGVFGTSSGPGSGVYGFANGSNTAVRGLNTSTGDGVYGSSNSTGNGVHGSSANGVGGYFTSGTYDAVQGHVSSGFSGVAGFNESNGPGTYGQSTNGNGVQGRSTNGDGVQGRSTNGDGVYGESSDSDGNGVYGVGSDGVVGFSNGTSAAASIYGANPASHCSSCWAGYFGWNAHVNGTLSASAKSFKIDHPTDPANKYLIHTSVESPDMLNIYRGHAILDAQGSAWVQMPDWFEALNMDFDYQLTAIGKAQPNLYVAQEIKANKFQIAGGVAGAKVSWQVTGVRHDPYAEAYRTPVEVEKSPEEKGLYQHPELYSQPDSTGINTLYSTTPEQPQSATGGHK